MARVEILLPFILLCFLFTQCNNAPQPPTPEEEIPSPHSYPFSAVPFPNPGIPGFMFPEDSNTINGWITNGDMDKIYQHGWGIWTGLTMLTDQKIGDQSLTLFDPNFLGYDLVLII